MRKHHRSAFTLVELLVVVGIIAVLISILLPALNRVRENARDVNCKSNLRQVFLASRMFASENNDSVPRGAKVWEDRSQPLAYLNKLEGNTAFLMDGTDGTNGQGKADFERGCIWRYISPTNGPARRTIIMCPSDQVGQDRIRYGGLQTIERNFSYSFNHRITAEVEDDGTLAEIGRASWKKPSPASIKFGQVLQSARKIFIYEELGPNDGWCTDPNGQDDFPSGRHGNRKGGTMVMGVAEEKGSGNHCFFDGHVEGIPPIQLIRDLRTHKPLTVRGVAGF